MTVTTTTSTDGRTANRLVLSTAGPALGSMAGTLGAQHIAVPACPVEPGSADGADGADGATRAWAHAAVLDAWRAEIAAGERVDAVVVAVWTNDVTASALVDVSPSELARRLEWPFAAWYAAMGAAVARCVDGGTVVALVERPSPLDSAGWATESGIADAVEAFVRSLARSEGPRGVRINGVTTPSRLAPAHPVAPPPPLQAFPGRIDVEVVQAVEMLLGQGTAGVTGTIVHVDCGRSWR